ncbi:MAG: glycosyltransferase family 39 protein, partial [Chloroflexota bacterium]
MAASSIQTESNKAVLTWEQVFYAGAIVCAVVLRFSNLGVVPLSPDEGENAWGVWQFWQPESAERIPEVSSAAWFSLTALVTQITGYTDLIMRLFPALAGVLTIVAIAKLRPLTGRLGAIIAAFIVAISPLLVSTSRMADGHSLAVLALVMCVGLLLQWQNGGTDRTLLWLAGWLGFGLATSPVFYSGIVAFGLAWLLQITVGPNVLDSLSVPEGDSRRRAIITFVAVLALSATMFLLNP